MQISVRKLSKRYSSEWIFKDLDFKFHSSNAYAITGSNGSGKSTFLQILAGKLPPTKGQISFEVDGKNISTEDWYKKVAMCAPYMEMIEEFSLNEMIRFHFALNSLLPDVNKDNLLSLIGMEQHKNKKISELSSGMKQKLKLTLAIFTNKECLILDEPGSNLDQNAKKWLNDTLSGYRGDRIIIIASNDQNDFQENSIRLNVEDFK